MAEKCLFLPFVKREGHTPRGKIRFYYFWKAGKLKILNFSIFSNLNFLAEEG